MNKEENKIEVGNEDTVEKFNKIKLAENRGKRY
jgi:hypothetical protein